MPPTTGPNYPLNTTSCWGHAPLAVAPAGKLLARGHMSLSVGKAELFCNRDKRAVLSPTPHSSASPKLARLLCCPQWPPPFSPAVKVPVALLIHAVICGLPRLLEEPYQDGKSGGGMQEKTNNLSHAVSQHKGLICIRGEIIVFTVNTGLF